MFAAQHPLPASGESISDPLGCHPFLSPALFQLGLLGWEDIQEAAWESSQHKPAEPEWLLTVQLEHVNQTPGRELRRHTSPPDSLCC